jgi:murein L,D-transpeptidase YcbB/YkuD
MSKLFISTSIAALMGAFVVTATVPVSAEGIERKFSFNRKKKTSSKKTQKRRQGRFRFFGIFDQQEPGLQPRSRKIRETRLRTVRKAKAERSKIYSYRADRLVVLGDGRLRQPGNKVIPLFSGKAPKGQDLTPEMGGAKLDDSLAQTIFELLKSGNTSVSVTKKQKKAIIAFYKSRNYKAVWADMDGFQPAALHLLTYMSKAEQDGLRYRDYLPVGLRDYNEDLGAVESDLVDMARLEISLTAMAVRYGQDASGGRIVPNRLSGYHDLRPPRVAAATILKNLEKSPLPGRYLASLHPSHPSYGAFKKMLALLDNASPEKVYRHISTTGTIKPGQTDARVGLVRERLNDLGLLSGLTTSDGQPVNPVDVYDAEMVEAVKTYQRSKKLAADGIMGRRTLATFNRRKNINKRNKLVMNMERMRWLPRRFGSKHVFVNQASFKLQVIQNNREIWRTKVVVGKPKNQTSFFIDKMRTVVFNPYWGVPQSIITKEMLPRLQANPGYLDQKGFEVYNRSGRKVSSSSVDWYNYGGSRVPFSVRQPPGSRNALGRIKFLFPNKHAIYMHDTPSKSLFSRSSRAFSHGCVRVKDPLKFAENILGWKRGLIDRKIAAGKNSSVKLKKTVPVYLAYFTAWASPAGKVSFYSDIYGRDRLLDRALNTVAVAQK